MANAYFEATGFDYIRKSQNEVLGQLARNHHHALEDKQRFAWEKQIEIMCPIMAEYPKAHVYFEFSIPRMGKRAELF